MKKKKKIAWLLDREIGAIDRGESLWDYFGEVELFAPLVSQPMGQKHRYPSGLTPEEMEKALLCDEIFITRLHEGVHDELLMTLLVGGRKPLRTIFVRIDTQSYKNDYCEYHFAGFERVMDDSLKRKVLVPQGKDISGMNPEDFEVITPE